MNIFQKALIAKIQNTTHDTTTPPVDLNNSVSTAFNNATSQHLNQTKKTNISALNQIPKSNLTINCEIS